MAHRVHHHPLQDEASDISTLKPRPRPKISHASQDSGKRTVDMRTTINAEQSKTQGAATVMAQGAENMRGETRARPKVLDGCTVKMKTGCSALYVTINRLGERCHELFARAGKAGGCAASQCEAIGRLISLAWRKGAQPEEVVEQLRGITCQQQNEEDSEQARSCADGVARAIAMVLSNEE